MLVRRPMTLVVLLASCLTAESLLAQRGAFGGGRRGGQNTDAAPVRDAAPIPTRRSRLSTRSPAPPTEEGGGTALEFPTAFRSISGAGNNLANPDWGSVDTELLRLTRASYADGDDSPSGANRVSARDISNACAAQDENRPNAVRASDYLWQWGQFVDHDIDITETIDPAEPFDIAVPTWDPDFDPQGTGTQAIGLNRSFYAVDEDGVRQQVNGISAFIDGSNVYGSDEGRAFALRTLDGSGKLKTSDGDLLPFNTAGLANAPTAFAPNFFLAGDVRANEQAALTAMHTLFVREHNHWADQLAQADASLTGEDIYQMARVIVVAELQAVTYNEFLPVLLGEDALAAYRGYRANVNPGIANCFSTAAYRLGHSMLSTELKRIGSNGEAISEGHLSLAAAFFNPTLIIEEGGIDPLLRGMATQVCQSIDNLVIDDVRNFLFGAPGAGGFDLASLNIQRGRDHGLASYNQTRRDYGLRAVRRFADIHPSQEVQQNLAEVYNNIENIDLWVGGLAEQHVPGALVGPTYRAILSDQFERLRDGDRFWYQNYLSPEMIDLVENQSLAQIIRRNTDIGRELQNDVFRVPAN